MNAANQRRLTPVLAVSGVLLAAVWLLLLSGIGRSVHWAAPRPLTPLPPAGNAADLPSAVPLQQFARIWQTPLFSPDRKPVARAADGGSSLGDLDLTGIILTSGLRMALLHDKNGDRQVRLREGESLPDGSVTLVEIRPRSALFDSSAGRTELKLPAGAPIDQRKAGAASGSRDRNATAPTDATARNSSGAIMMGIEAGGEGVRKPELRPEDARPSMPTPPSARDVPTQRPPPQNPAAPPAVNRLRENIQKRRAVRAAAANEGVR